MKFELGRAFHTTRHAAKIYGNTANLNAKEAKVGILLLLLLLL